MLPREVPSLAVLKLSIAQAMTDVSQPYLSRLQKSHHIKRLFYVWDLVLQARSPPCSVDFHELVFPGGCSA